MDVIIKCELCDKEILINNIFDANEVYDIAWYHKRGYCSLNKQDNTLKNYVNK